MEYERYKIIVQVVIGEQRGEGVKYVDLYSFIKKLSNRNYAVIFSLMAFGTRFCGTEQINILLLFVYATYET